MSGNRDQEDGAALPTGSLARLIDEYREGDASRLGELMGLYFAELLVIARRRVRRAPHLQSRTDDEAAVSSAYRTFLRRAKEGKFAYLNHKHELLPTLVTIVIRKIGHQKRKHSSQKAGDGGVQNEPEEGLSPPDPSPDAEITYMEWHEWIKVKGARFREEMLIEVAELKMAQYQYREIAQALELSEAKVRRLFTIINKLTAEFLELTEKPAE